MKKNKNQENTNVTKKEDKSFFEKMRTDKQYNAKVQLMGFGIFILLLIIYLNLANGSRNIASENSIIGDFGNDSFVESTDQDSGSLLEKLNDNYSYDVVLKIKDKNVDTLEEEEKIVHYSGKSYEDNLEISKDVDGNIGLYYRVGDLYYSKVDNGVSLVKEDVIYDIIESKYIELDDILNLIDKASLDHVTDYSSGKKEYVYHLLVRDVVVSYKLEDVVEVDIEEENGELDIEIDYSNLLKVIDENILECKLEAKITQIGEVEKFDVVVDEGEGGLSE